MKHACLIISGGEFDPYLPSADEYDYVIACDKGYEYACALGLVPDIVIGDMDSVSCSIPKDVKTILLPKEKDDTDTSCAIKHAISLGYTDISVLCAMGGRPDHAFANIQALCGAAALNTRARMVSSDAVIHALCSSSITLKRKEGWNFSVFSASDCCRGVVITGAYYPLDGAELYNTFPKGQSNEWAAEEAMISCGSGFLIVMETKI